MSLITYVKMDCIRCHKSFDYEQEFEMCDACAGLGCYECLGEGHFDLSELPPLCPICYFDEYGDEDEWGE